jgi:F-type H+-transporting ATPase subunit a
MMFLAEAAPGSHPTVSLGCGNWCTFNIDSLISSGIAIAVTLIVLFAIAYRVSRGVPGKLQMVVELLLNYVQGAARDFVGEVPPFVIPLAMTIFIYILIANWLDFFPLPLVPNVHGANSDLNQTLAMALVVFIASEIYSIRVLGLGGFLRRFTKPFDLAVPLRAGFVILNIIEEVAKPITLSLRLFGNIFALAVMVYLIGLLLASNFGFFGAFIIGPVALAAWKLFDVFLIGTIQAFIFMLLTIIYFGQAREGLEEAHH